MNENNGFKLPKSFITQLEEFTAGFLLITIDDTGEFVVYKNLDNTTQELAMSQFVELLNQSLRVNNAALEIGFKSPEELEDDSGDEADQFKQ